MAVFRRPFDYAILARRRALPPGKPAPAHPLAASASIAIVGSGLLQFSDSPYLRRGDGGLNSVSLNGGNRPLFLVPEWSARGDVRLVGAPEIGGAVVASAIRAAPVDGAALGGHAIDHGIIQPGFSASVTLVLSGTATLRVGAALFAEAGLALVGTARIRLGVRPRAEAGLTLIGVADLTASPFAVSPGRPLADPLDLRDTSVWPGYDQIAIIPRVYGRTRVSGLRYAAHGKTYVLADHALAGVDAVYDGGVAIAGWRHDNGADLTGHAVAFLQLSAVPKGAISADVRGLSGNPAAVLADLYPRAAAPDLAVRCLNAGIELGGALLERTTLRGALQFVVDQFGGAWSAGMAGFATFFPPPDDGPLQATFGRLDVADASAECQLDALITRLTVPFDWDYAANKARQSLALTTDTSTRFGERPAQLALPWVKTAREALEIATRYLQWRGRPLWAMTWTAGVQYRELQPGGWITIDIGLPIVGMAVVTDIDPGYGSGTVKISAQAPAGLAPRVTVVRAGAAFE